MKSIRMLAVVLSLGLLGCGQESSMKTETVTETPGGTTTTTEEKKIETTGENPPPVGETPTTPAPANP